MCEPSWKDCFIESLRGGIMKVSSWACITKCCCWVIPLPLSSLPLMHIIHMSAIALGGFGGSSRSPFLSTRNSRGPLLLGIATIPSMGSRGRSSPKEPGEEGISVHFLREELWLLWRWIKFKWCVLTCFLKKSRQMERKGRGKYLIFLRREIYT